MGTPVLYVDTDAVRAVVGVKVKEVPDAMFTDQQMERQLKTALYGWLPTYEALYDTGSAGGATADQSYIRDLITSYCLFYCAVRVIEMVLALRHQVGDGKSEVKRFDTDFKELLEVFNARLDEAQGLLEDLTSTGGTDGAQYFGKATPDYDPVSNT